MQPDRNDPRHRAAARRVLARLQECQRECCANLTLGDVLGLGFATPDFLGVNNWHGVQVKEMLRESDADHYEPNIGGGYSGPEWNDTDKRGLSQ